MRLGAIDHRLHGLADDARRALTTGDGTPEASDIPDYEDRWKTYLKARNGASELGDNVAASSFYYREMRNRRRLHIQRATDPDREPLARLGDVTRWVRNGSLGLVTGYGEHPDRVLYSSVGMILAFTAVYAVVLAPPFAGAGLAGYLVLSLQSFVTFLLGSPATTPLAGEVLTAIEGFLGAFLVALFVFTMTRRIRR